MSKIILALDTNNLNLALNTAKKFKNKIFTIKLGLEFFNAHGKNGVKKFNDIGFNNIMLDLKLNDIGNTCYKAIKSLRGIKFKYLTVHALGGPSMIKSCKDAAKELNPNLKILVVTVLTSLNNKDIRKLGFKKEVGKLVEQLAKNSSYADGFVCSGREAIKLRKIFSKKKLIFCPGIRMIKDKKNDQKRFITPKQAIKNGADKIIMGRSILIGNSEKKLENIIKSIN